jgi:hypothetical protein
MKTKSIIWGIVTLVVLWFILFPALFMEAGIYRQWIAPGIFCIIGMITLCVWIKNELLTIKTKIK